MTPEVTIKNVGDGTSADFFVTTPGAVELFYAIDTLGPIDWISLGVVNGPGTFRYENFLEGLWYIGMGIQAGEPGRAVRFRVRSPEPKYSVELYRQSVERAIKGVTTCWRLRVEAINPVGIEDAVFLYQRTSTDPVCDEFCAVVTPEQMESVREDVPFEGDDLLRKNYVDLLAGNMEELEEIFQLLKHDVVLLLEAWELNAVLAQDSVCPVTGHISVPELPEPGPSSSSSAAP